MIRSAKKIAYICHEKIFEEIFYEKDLKIFRLSHIEITKLFYEIESKKRKQIIIVGLPVFYFWVFTNGGWSKF